MSSSHTRANDRILLAHGGGGELMRELILNDILPALGQAHSVGGPPPLPDSAVLEVPGCPQSGRRLAFTTDSYVVKPLFFRGGDIGQLAVCGTVNDLAVVGARPIALSLGFIVEEGLLLADFRRAVKSVGRTAQAADVPVVTGDVKVVERGSADGLFINTAGIGIVAESVELDARRVEPGDRILVSGPIGNHGIAVLSAREGIGFETPVKSDVACLSELAQAVLRVGGRDVHWMRDPTRGGLAACLTELAQDARVEVTISECAIPIEAGVLAACALLGLDPLVVANEGKLLVVVAADAAAGVLSALWEHRLGTGARMIGRVTGRGHQRVVLETETGGHRLVEMPYGEELPRIC